MDQHIRVILFDIGGTLVNKLNHGSRDLVMLSEMAQFLGEGGGGQALAERIAAREDEYKAWRKRSLTELSYAERWTRFLLPEYPPEFIRQNAGRLQAWWSDSRGKRWISPQTVLTLQELAGRGYILGSVSHTSPKYLDEAGILGLFHATVLAAELGKRKPHPAPFLAAARACGASPAECAYVGDRPSRDVVGAREAGIGRVVLLQHDGETVADEPPTPMRADVVIHTLPELLDCFPKIHTRRLTPRDGQLEPEVLYDVALSSMWWARETDSGADFCAKARRLGFARIELNHQVPPADLEAIDLERTHIGSLHDPCPAVIPNKQLEREDRVITSLDARLRRDGVEVVKRTIEAAYRLGARHVVIHPGRISGDHGLDNTLREMFRAGLKDTPGYAAQKQALVADRQARAKPHLEMLLASLDEIVAFAADSGLTLGLENRYHYYELPIFEEMEILLATFPQPWVGWQLDVGHLQAYDALGLFSFQQWLERFAARIVAVHLHDISGISDHRPPGCGDFDFNWLAPYLPEAAYRAVEVSPAWSYADMQRGLSLLEQAGCITRV